MTTVAAQEPRTTPLSQGSVWRKWDFHVHTPSSFDYGDKSVQNEVIVKSLRDAGIAAAVISDHHKIDKERINALREAHGPGPDHFPWH